MVCSLTLRVLLVLPSLAHGVVLGSRLPKLPLALTPRRCTSVPAICMMEQSPGSATLESIAEAPTEATHSQRPPPTDEEIASVFRECDTSGDGFIDLSELCAALGKAGQPASRETARAMLLQVDANGDEQISLDEFRQIFLLDAPDELKGLAGNFDRFIDEVRFEVDSTEFNGPILLTAFTAASTGIFWKSIVAFAALYTSSEGFVGGAEQLPALVEVFKSIPAGFLTDYSKAVELAPLLTMSCTSMFAYAIGDLVGQGVEGRRRVDLLDLGRCARNAALGFGLHGPLVYGWIQVGVYIRTLLPTSPHSPPAISAHSSRHLPIPSPAISPSHLPPSPHLPSADHLRYSNASLHHPYRSSRAHSPPQWGADRPSGLHCSSRSSSTRPSSRR